MVLKNNWKNQIKLKIKRIKKNLKQLNFNLNLMIWSMWLVMLKK